VPLHKISYSSSCELTSTASPQLNYKTTVLCTSFVKICSRQYLASNSSGSTALLIAWLARHRWVSRRTLNGQPVSLISTDW
jgi:hypothetical protein